MDASGKQQHTASGILLVPENRETSLTPSCIVQTGGERRSPCRSEGASQKLCSDCRAKVESIDGQLGEMVMLADRKEIGYVEEWFENRGSNSIVLGDRCLAQEGGTKFAEYRMIGDRGKIPDSDRGRRGRLLWRRHELGSY